MENKEWGFHKTKGLGGRIMQLAKDRKVCLECKVDLARYWGNNFCEPCFRVALKKNIEEEDKRHEAGRVK